jgi:hypothetical protein
LLQKYVPGHFNNPVGLAVRLVRSGDRAALYAMWTAAIGLALTPLDFLLAMRERQLYEDAPDPALPIVLVCGPSRAGTTLAEQVLIATTRPTYLNNLTSLFPRSPIIANRAFRDVIGEYGAEFRSYYGKSVGLAGPNDALYLWDRWLGPQHRSAPVTRQARIDLGGMRHFFGAMQAEHGAPVLNKNNHLNCCAHLVAPILPTARFVCLRRQREHLAQSLLLARQDIHGDSSVPYGIGSPVGGDGSDPIEDVCRQVLYHERMAQWQQEQLGADRFRIVQYEDLCRDPLALAGEICREVLGGQGRTPDESDVQPFEPSTRIRVRPEEYARILEVFSRIEGREEEYWVEPWRPETVLSDPA